MAADFVTVEVWTASGLKRFLVLFFLDLSTRRVEIAGLSQAGATPRSARSHEAQRPHSIP